METIKKYLERLPEPYRSGALKNADPEVLADLRDSSVCRAAEALSAAFVWSSSPEGDAYWRELYVRLLRDEAPMGIDKLIQIIKNGSNDLLEE